MEPHYNDFLKKIQKGLEKLSEDDLNEIPEDVREQLRFVETSLKEKTNEEQTESDSSP